MNKQENSKVVTIIIHADSVSFAKQHGAVVEAYSVGHKSTYSLLQHKCLKILTNFTQQTRSIAYKTVFKTDNS